MATALLLIDFINEIVHENGKLSKKGYYKFIKNNNIFQNLHLLTKKAREQKIPIIHVKVGFSSDYKELPINSPLFGKAKEFEALKLGTWATEFHEKVDIKKNDIVIIKHRVSAFYQTQLEEILIANNIDSILIAGVATDLAVASTVREAHDRDYNITIIADCCAAANDEDHKNSLQLLSKIAAVKNCDELV